MAQKSLVISCLGCVSHADSCTTPSDNLSALTAVPGQCVSSALPAEMPGGSPSGAPAFPCHPRCRGAGGISHAAPWAWVSSGLELV